MDADLTIDKILLKLLERKNKEIVTFCGAGISINSGLPAAIPLLTQILVKLNVDEVDLNDFVLSDKCIAMPFESFMEVFLDNSNDNSLLDTFKLGNPNTNHFFLKKLTEKNKTVEIYTTNFDLLIEKAFERDVVPLYVYRDETEYSQIERLNFETNKLIKIHGSIDSINSIRTTISTITNKSLSTVREKIIERVFTNKGKHNTVIILGYSCSDIFDIIPRIEKIHNSDKEIIYIEHCSHFINKSDVIIEPMSARKTNNPFNTFRGYWIKVNTDKFIEWFWNLIDNDYPGVEFNSELWTDIIDNWILSFHAEYLKYTIIGQLFFKLQNLDKSLKYHNISLSTNNAKNKRGQGASLSNIGLIYHAKNDYDNALSFFFKAKVVFESIDFYFGICAAYTNIGYTYIFKEKRNEAFKWLKKSLHISKKNDFKENKLCEADALSSLGLLYYKFKEYDIALFYYFSTLDIDKNGNKEGEEITLAEIGKVYTAKENQKKAIVYYKKAFEIASKLGHKETVESYEKIIQSLLKE